MTAQGQDDAAINKGIPLLVTGRDRSGKADDCAVKGNNRAAPDRHGAKLRGHVRHPESLHEHVRTAPFKANSHTIVQADEDKHRADDKEDTAEDANARISQRTIHRRLPLPIDVLVEFRRTEFRTCTRTSFWIGMCGFHS